MHTPTVTIIIPVYNVEKYLRECIQSVLVQTLSDFELLLINDGSTDNSGKICNEYALQDVRIQVFHKKNEGVSSARNYGLDYAKGKWVAFIDSDDWVEATYLEHLLQGNDAVEYRVAGFVDYTRKAKKNNVLNEELFSGEHIQKYYKKYIDTFTVFAVWGKLYVLNIINTHAIRFDTRLSYGEDNVFNFMYIKHINTIGVYNYVEYHYRYVGNSLANSASLQQRELSFQMCEQAVLQILDTYEENTPIQKHIGNKYLNLCVQKVKYMYRNKQSSNKEQLKEMFAALKKYEKNALHKRKLLNNSFTTALFLLLYFIGNVRVADKVLRLFFR